MTGLSKHDYIMFVAIITVTVLIRFPFFTLSVIDWDESTYLVGSSLLLDGFFLT